MPDERNDVAHDYETTGGPLAIQKGRVQSLRHCLFNHRSLRGDPQKPA
jgi:hypothetical protein